MCLSLKFFYLIYCGQLYTSIDIDVLLTLFPQTCSIHSSLTVTPSFLILRQNPQGLLQWLNFSPTLHLACQEILIWNLATSYHSGLVILKHGPDHCLAQLLLRVTPAPSSECSLCSEFVHVFLLAPDTQASMWTLDTFSISCATPQKCTWLPSHHHKSSPKWDLLGEKVKVKE